MIEKGTPESHLLQTTDFYLGKANGYLKKFAEEISNCNLVDALHAYKNTNFFIEKAKDYASELEKIGEEDIGKKKRREAHDLEDKGVDIAVTRGSECECKHKPLWK